ncbi:MAG: shikimate dehydrogenase family protein [Maricaulaceae bacterium]
MSKVIPKMAGVCGWPIHHSLSPQLHSYWLKEMGIAGAYVPFAVRPDEAVRAFKSLKRTSISGVNVTIPLKKLAFEAADETTEEAAKLGVANCLFKRDGKLIAHNTDMAGFTTPLIRAAGPSHIQNMPAVIYGTGGASRAVIGALLAMQCPEIRLCGRTDSKALDMASDVNAPNLYAVPWAKRHDIMRGAGLIINASAGGMKGRPVLDVKLDKAEDNAIIYDLIYTPIITPFIKSGQERGLKTIGGLDMLIEQARPSFLRFFGTTPPHDLDPAPLLKRLLKDPSA